MVVGDWRRRWGHCCRCHWQLNPDNGWSRDSIRIDKSLRLSGMVLGIRNRWWPIGIWRLAVVRKSWWLWMTLLLQRDRGCDIDRKCRPTCWRKRRMTGRSLMNSIGILHPSLHGARLRKSRSNLRLLDLWRHVIEGRGRRRNQSSRLCRGRQRNGRSIAIGQWSHILTHRAQQLVQCCASTKIPTLRASWRRQRCIWESDKRLEPGRRNKYLRFILRKLLGAVDLDVNVLKADLHLS